MKSEIREFAVHKNILLSVMQAQAGSLSKALMEGVMNSIDADASRVAIKLDLTSFSIVDNGKGIQDRQAITDYFETFGTPHVEGDAKLGVFRIGRGQLMSFAATKWRTGTFGMHVDIENGSLGYTLTENLPSSIGCSIEGKLYEELNELAQREIERDFKELVKFAPINVYLNGKLISRNPLKMSWDYEDEFAYYKLNNSDEMALFNLGLLVSKLPSYRFGVGGLIVSKKQLKVNFARNDVLQNKCDVWRIIGRTIEALSLRKTMTKGSLTPSERNFLVRQWVYGLAPKSLSKHFAALKLITVATGKHISLNEFIETAKQSRVSVATGAKSQLASRLHRDGSAVVLAQCTLDRFYVSDLEELAAQLGTLSPECQGLAYCSLESLATDFSDSFTQLNSENTNSRALCMLEALRSNHESFFKWFKAGERSSGMRELVAGKSDVALAWTDGKSYIAITEKELLKASKQGEIGCFNLLLTLTHEYCHDDADLETHDHDIVFMTKHHDLIQYQGGQLFKIARQIYAQYGRLAKALGSDDSKSPAISPAPRVSRTKSRVERPESICAKLQLKLPL